MDERVMGWSMRCGMISLPTSSPPSFLRRSSMSAGALGMAASSKCSFSHCFQFHLLS